jgi:hypothetical protein
MMLPFPYNIAAPVVLAVAAIGGGALWVKSVKNTAYEAGYATCDAVNVKAAFVQSEKVRAKESQLNNTNRKVANDYKAENDRLRADAADAQRLLDALQAAATAASATDTSTVTGTADPYPRAFVECAVALTEVDKEYQRIRGVAQALQGYAREVCVTELK